MADGTHKRIKDIKISDWVLATDPETGEQVAKRVTHLWVHHDELTELVLNVDADGDGVPDRLVTTEDHPFWNVTDQTWEGPEEFTAGDEVIDEQWNRIEVTELDPRTTRRDLAYNLTVEDIHTYHVGTADTLVHDTGPACKPGGAGEPNIVYRGPRPNENPAQGLSARAPDAADVTPLSHVTGKIESPWISTSERFGCCDGQVWRARGRCD